MEQAMKIEIDNTDFMKVKNFLFIKIYHPEIKQASHKKDKYIITHASDKEFSILKFLQLRKEM